MRRVQVRCWPHLLYGIHPESPLKLWMTAPEGHLGHRLITCLNCGEIYAVDVGTELYSEETLVDRLAQINCVKCGRILGEHWAAYPDQYLYAGQVYSFERPSELPADQDTVLQEFNSIY